MVELAGRDGLRRLASRIATRESALVIPHSDLCSQWPDVLVEEVNKLGLPAVFDGRWLVERGALMSLEPVSYTHLDVYKRQEQGWLAAV